MFPWLLNVYMKEVNASDGKGSGFENEGREGKYRVWEINQLLSADTSELKVE